MAHMALLSPVSLHVLLLEACSLEVATAAEPDGLLTQSGGIDVAASPFRESTLRS